VLQALYNLSDDQARKPNVRSITACAGLSRRRYHDNEQPS
jgi:hypothetical protein